MNETNPAKDAFAFLLQDYLDRTLPFDPAANYVRLLFEKQIRCQPEKVVINGDRQIEEETLAPALPCRTGIVLPSPPPLPVIGSKGKPLKNPAHAAKIRAALARKKAEKAREEDVQ